MKAELFDGGADGPDAAIDRADDGTPLDDRRGWTCGGCDALFAARADAEACCTDRPLLRLYAGGGTD